MENKIFYGVIRISKGGNFSMIERVFDTCDKADTYACDLELLPYAQDLYSVVKIEYNPNFM